MILIDPPYRTAVVYSGIHVFLCKVLAKFCKNFHQHCGVYCHINIAYSGVCAPVFVYAIVGVAWGHIAALSENFSKVTYAKKH